MIKILIFTFTVILLYIFFLKESSVIKSVKKSEVSEIQVAPKLVDNPKQKLSGVAVKVDVLTRVQQFQKASNSSVNNSATLIEKPEIEKQTDKYAQIIPEYGDYAPTPQILTGQSAKIFSLNFPDQVIPDFEVKNIESAFMQGISPPENIIQILGLNDIFTGSIYLKNEIKYNLSWDLQIEAHVNPLNGFFSLEVNGIEKSCNPRTAGPLKNINLLSKVENGAILIESCDKSFYMQLYRSGANILSGLYFEKNEVDGKYKYLGDVSLYRRAQDNE